MREESPGSIGRGCRAVPGEGNFKESATEKKTWAEKAEDIKLSGNSTVSGFALGLKAMHAGEKASFVFGYNLGYGSSGSGNLIPAYAALRFDVEMVPAP